MGIMLERFIISYVPNGWKESISKVIFVPTFTTKEISNIYEAFQFGKLEEEICDKPWYIRRVITQFFKEKINEKYL